MLREVHHPAVDGVLGRLEPRLDAGQPGQVRAPLLDAHRVAPAPVHRGGRHRGRGQQAGHHGGDVVGVQRVVDAGRVAVDRDGVAREHHVQVDGGPAAVVAVRDGQAGDRRRQPVALRRPARRALGPDLADAVRAQERPHAVVVAERAALVEAHGGRPACTPRSDEQWRKARAPRWCSMREARPPRLAARSASQSFVLATAKFRTYSASAGNPPTSPEARSTGTHSMPDASSSVRTASSLKRAAPTTRLSRARATARGRATWPVTPVTTMVLPDRELRLMLPLLLATLPACTSTPPTSGAISKPDAWARTTRSCSWWPRTPCRLGRRPRPSGAGGGRPHVDALTRLGDGRRLRHRADPERPGRRPGDRGLRRIVARLRPPATGRRRG